MITIGEAIQRVQSLYSRGVQSDDTRLSSRHIYSKLISARAMILYQQMSKKNKINDWNYQTLKNVQLVTINIEGVLKVAKTVLPLPKPIRSNINHSIEYVIGSDTPVRFDETNKKELLYIKGNRYTSRNAKYIIENNHMYLYCKRIPNSIEIKMLCEDPYEGYLFSNPDIDTPFNLQFPVDEDLIDVIIELAYKELVELFKTQKEDTKTDAKDNIAQ